MSSLEIFAVVCLLTGLIGETIVFRRIQQQVRRFRDSIPFPEHLSIQTVKLSTQEINSTTAEVLAERYTTSEAPLTNGNVTLTLLRQEVSEQPTHPIVLSINRYLIKARGAVWILCLSRTW